MRDYPDVDRLVLMLREFKLRIAGAYRLIHTQLAGSLVRCDAAKVMGDAAMQGFP